MRNVLLQIDTSSNQEITIAVIIDGKEDKVVRKLDQRKAQIVLPIIADLLAKNHLNPKDITAIQVHSGPGSFVGVRVGISIANILAAVLQIPVNGKPVGSQVEATYQDTFLKKYTQSVE